MARWELTGFERHVEVRVEDGNVKSGVDGTAGDCNRQSEADRRVVSVTGLAGPEMKGGACTGSDWIGKV